MIDLNIRRKGNGIPILSQREIDLLGERILAEFAPEALFEPQEIDIELFVQDYLRMEQDYQYLSHCGIYLGMTVFSDTNRVPIYNPEKKRAEFISAKAGTIIIDNSLLGVNQEHRYRFTMGHEAGHGLLHEAYFVKRSNLDRDQVTMPQCRTDYSAGVTNQRLQTNHDWMEWQANAMSSAILMPKCMVRKLVEEIDYQKRGYVNEDVLSLIKIMKVSETFNVSNEAATYRMKTLKLLDKDYRCSKAAFDFMDITSLGYTMHL